MAASIGSRLLRLSMSCHKPLVTQVRTAIYPVNYQQPTYKKQDLTKPLEDSDPRRFNPIRAAENYQSSSLFHDDLVQKFTRMMMKGGNKARVEDIMEKTLENLKRMQVEKYHRAETAEERGTIECDPVAILYQAVDNCKPVLKLTRVIKGGVAYQVPVPCTVKDQQYKAMRWLIDSCRDKERKLPMENKLAWEISDAYKGQGKSVRKKQELHRMCESNKAYAHYRW